MHCPDITKEHCEVSYTLPGSSTGLEVRGFKVQKSTPERWVKYEIHYHYRVQMFPDLSIDWWLLLLLYMHSNNIIISHCYDYVPWCNEDVLDNNYYCHLVDFKFVFQ